MSAFNFTANALSNSAIITATGKVNYIQDFTKAMCQTKASSSAITVQDRRDGQNYTVRYINGNCWMTRNLAIGCNGSGDIYSANRRSITLSKTYSNVSSSYTLSSAAVPDFNSSNNSGPDGCTTATMKCDATYGAWYNYITASAGTIRGTSNTSTQTYDICPANWRLPSNDEFTSSIFDSTIFNPVRGGVWYQGELVSTEHGNWWASTYSSGTGRYSLAYNDDGYSTNDSMRLVGRYVRCIRSN